MKPDAEAVPAEMIYGILFREMESFERKASEKGLSDLTGYYRTAVGGLTQHFAEIKRIGLDCASQSNQYHNQLQAIGRALAAQGKAPSAQLPPTEEVANLAKHEKEVILQAVNQLRYLLGETDFAAFDKHVRAYICAGLHYAVPDSEAEKQKEVK